MQGNETTAAVPGAATHGTPAHRSPAHRSPRGARTLLRVVLALSGWAAFALTALPDGWLPRWIPILFFVAFCPGLAVLLPLRPGAGSTARGEALALVAPLSLSLATLAATGLYVLDAFTTVLFLVPLAAFTTVAALLPGLRLTAATRDTEPDAAP